MEFSGTGYNHQNIVAEGEINIMVNMARARMLYEEIRCPEGTICFTLALSVWSNKYCVNLHAEGG